MKPQSIGLLRGCVEVVHEEGKPTELRQKCRRLLGWLRFAAWRGGHPDPEAAVAALLTPWLTVDELQTKCNDLARYVSDADFMVAALWATEGIDVGHDLTDENTAQG